MALRGIRRAIDAGRVYWKPGVRDHPLAGSNRARREGRPRSPIPWSAVARVRLGNAGLVHDGMVEEAVEPGGTAGGKESPDAPAARKHAPLEPLVVVTVAHKAQVEPDASRADPDPVEDAVAALIEGRAAAGRLVGANAVAVE